MEHNPHHTPPLSETHRARRGGSTALITPERLRGSDRDRALRELRALLVRGLTAALGPNVPATAIEDFAQDALMKILDNLDSFRGESRFTTWAQKIAVRVAYTELRRARWRDYSLEEMTDRRPEDGLIREATMVDPDSVTEQSVARKMMLEEVGRFVEEELTERQRQALIAVTVAGAPLEEVARRMDSNRNALYKLLHDARRKLKKRMEAEGFRLDETLAGLDEEARLLASRYG